MKVKVRTCVDGVFFDACHFNRVGDEVLLHGHTFEVSVCVEGGVGGEGWVVDFSELRGMVEDVVSRFRYALMIPKELKGAVDFKGPFNVRYAYIEGRATAESLAMLICGEVLEGVRSINPSVRAAEVWVKEGVSGTASARCEAGSPSD
ncbi:MAG: 6-carboxytetrahydropterin synthase [Desulfurococcales archaeon]|nr:6-carboxytetrahydropterin synthase [Desulfurococcales archaeon]